MCSVKMFGATGVRCKWTVSLQATGYYSTGGTVLYNTVQPGGRAGDGGCISKERGPNTTPHGPVKKDIVRYCTVDTVLYRAVQYCTVSYVTLYNSTVGYNNTLEDIYPAVVWYPPVSV